MNHIGYDAMNLGESDILYGMEELEGNNPAIDFPIISTNLEAENRFPDIKKYVISEIDGTRIAILSIMPKNVFQPVFVPEYVEKIKILDPAEAIKKNYPGNPLQIRYDFTYIGI